MTLAFIAIVFGLALLVWSPDRFVEGAAPQGNPGIVLGNVYGSNITLILRVTALNLGYTAYLITTILA
ncbi:hypothetical protein [Desulfococcus multivorans]|jgi:cation:H+ antiporter|uniref:Uncharacterized protein n=1 Tax=Desulfococcus multivorans DSM 2059 TaxID=1121405 RepID=S7VC72_DESML|nr:hypothetical protein [Desulfococcus multivorans]MDY0038862.1 hypothetical protein [Desulforhabdus sp.]AOY57457.1 uncharacterized protein, Na+/Ca+ antiporter-related [Desulfococcus multivorans]AQU99891.1 hypothetical protein B2D07_03275 [Desulfococcus multivorans]EPR42083.1 hypothetical protein dsmv_1810 [Desulfococcus multivorans DSM 2059]SKA09072.1 cation:H+ antiporter [Desulfococcus multivorans DSM 2059]